MEQAEVLRNKLLGENLVKNLEKRGMAAYSCATKEEAVAKALELIPETDVVAWGGSVSIKEVGLLDVIKKRNPVIDREIAETSGGKAGADAQCPVVRHLFDEQQCY